MFTDLEASGRSGMIHRLRCLTIDLTSLTFSTEHPSVTHVTAMDEAPDRLIQPYGDGPVIIDEDIRKRLFSRLGTLYLRVWHHDMSDPSKIGSVRL